MRHPNSPGPHGPHDGTKDWDNTSARARDTSRLTAAPCIRRGRLGVRAAHGSGSARTFLRPGGTR
ncbi:hypothetical protein GCM10010193_26540 [Kitasatospora atroaurantiaca]